MAPSRPPRKRKLWIIPVVVGAVAAVAACGAFILLDPFEIFASNANKANAGIVVQSTVQPDVAQSDDSNSDSKTQPTDLAPDAPDVEELGYGNLDDDYILPEASTRRYTREELEKLDSKILWYARNEMYALHGKGFRTEELRDYFESKPWYKQLYTADAFDKLPEQLNEYELANEELMTQIEKERNSPYLH